MAGLFVRGDSTILTEEEQYTIFLWGAETIWAGAEMEVHIQDAESS